MAPLPQGPTRARSGEGAREGRHVDPGQGGKGIVQPFGPRRIGRDQERLVRPRAQAPVGVPAHRDQPDFGQIIKRDRAAEGWSEIADLPLHDLDQARCADRAQEAQAAQRDEGPEQPSSASMSPKGTKK